MDGARTETITGDIVVDDHLLEQWGLHLIDMNLAMGNLIEIVREEGRAYLAKQR